MQSTQPNLTREGRGHALWRLNCLNKPDKHELLVSAGAAAGRDVFGPMVRTLFPGIKNPPSLFCGSSSAVANVGDVLDVMTEHEIEAKHERKFSFDVTFSDVRVSKCEPATKTLHDIANLVDEIVSTIAPML
jgi:hypothetical protein